MSQHPYPTVPPGKGLAGMHIQWNEADVVEPTPGNTAPAVRVEFLAQAGTETWTLGEAELSADHWPSEVAVVLRLIADEFDQSLKEADGA